MEEDAAVRDPWGRWCKERPVRGRPRNSDGIGHRGGERAPGDAVGRGPCDIYPCHQLM